MVVVNSCAFVGHLGADPEKKYDSSGRPRISLRVAVSNRKKDRERDEWVDDTMWLRVTAFGPQAERASERLHKGSMVYVRGRLDTPSIWHGENGDRINLDLVAGEVIGLDKAERGEYADDDERGGGYREERREPQRQPAAAAARRAPVDDSPDLEDLPF